MANPTPTPWEREDLCIYATESVPSHAGRFTLRNRFTTWLQGSSGIKREELEANAELIVRAVNAHAALAKLLQTVELEDYLEVPEAVLQAAKDAREVLGG